MIILELEHHPDEEKTNVCFYQRCGMPDYWVPLQRGYTKFSKRLVPNFKQAKL